jgi:hypothetical protein
VAETKADEALRLYQQVSTSRGVWESHWQEIAERILPAYSQTFRPGGNSTPGAKKTELMFDSTGAVALGRFASVVDSLLTPQNKTWHLLKPSLRALQKDRQTALWFESLNEALFKYRYAPQSNFASNNFENFQSLGAFGTGAIFADRLRGRPGLRYRAIHLGEIYFLENHQGIIDTAIRRFPLKARQAVQKWGGKLPESIATAAAANSQQDYYFIHCVKPNEAIDAGRLDYRGMPFESYYISETGRGLLEEGGFNIFPYAISRYKTAPGEIYGRSPAMDVLPAIKTLNEEKLTVLKQGHRTVDPVLLAHDDGIVDGFSLRPGALNAGGVNADGRPLVHTLPVGNIAIGKDLMDDERKVINDAFLVSLFQILVDSPEMTATEVLERVKEKGILLAPTIGRQESEYLGPLIEREIDVLMQQGLIDPMPQALIEARGEYRIEYDSPMARARRAEDAAGLMRTVQMALEASQVTQDPAPLDHFDWDVIMPELADIQGVPARWMRGLDAIQAIREQRAQSAQQQQMLEAAPALAGAMKGVLPKGAAVAG